MYVALANFQIYEGSVATIANLIDNTWYHVFAISDGTNNDIGFDDNKNGLNLLANSSYNFYRRIGSILYLSPTDRIQKFTQRENFFYWHATLLSYNDNFFIGGTVFKHRATPIIMPNVPIKLQCKPIISGAGAATGTINLNTHFLGLELRSNNNVIASVYTENGWVRIETQGNISSTNTNVQIQTYSYEDLTLQN